MSNPDPSAGFSMIEVLVVVAIIAAVTMLISASVRPFLEVAPDAQELLDIVSEARTSAILSGEPQVISIEARRVSYRGTTREWGGGQLQVGEHAQPSSGGTRILLVNPDGSFSGDRLFITSPARSVPIPGIYRAEVRR